MLAHGTVWFCAADFHLISTRENMSRSQCSIEPADIAQLAKIAAEDRADLFARKPELGRLYKDRVLCVALCQGAALHFVDGKNGVKDFDVWTFYRAHQSGPYPYRRNVARDFGDQKFGTSQDRPDFVGRRVDCLGRSIPCPREQDPLEAVRDWLRSGRTKSARKLAEKAVVVLEPESERGTVIWQPPSGRAL